MSNKKSDLKSELTDILLGNEDSNKSGSQTSHDEPVTIGAPDHTEILQKKHDRAVANEKKHEPTFVTPPINPREARLRSTLPPPPSAPIPSSPAVAQTRIEQLEKEIDSLRNENQKLDTTNAALRTQLDEMTRRLVEWEKRFKDMVENKDLELQLAREELTHRTVRLQEVSTKLHELESRFEGEFHKIRVRERELQNRLEILKHEGNAVAKHKDETILELKRQAEKLAYEMQSYQKKNQGIHAHIESQQDRMKRAMKALRVAVALLDGEEEQALKRAK